MASKSVGSSASQRRGRHCSSAIKISSPPGTDRDNDDAHAELARIHECDSVQVAQTVSTTSLTTQSLQLGVTYIRNVWPPSQRAPRISGSVSVAFTPLALTV